MLALQITLFLILCLRSFSKDLRRGQVDDPNVGRIISPISFDFIKTNWHRIEEMELDFGVLKLCNIERKEHHVASGIVIEAPDISNSALSIDDLLLNELELSGFECGKSVNDGSKSWVDFELLESGLTEITGTVYINDEPYEIDGKTGELYISVNDPVIERSHLDDIDSSDSDLEDAGSNLQSLAAKLNYESGRRALLLDEGQLLLQVYITINLDLIPAMGTSKKALVRVIQAVEYSYDALADLGFELVIVGMKFQTLSYTGSNNGEMMSKIDRPPNTAHLTYHFGCYPNLSPGAAYRGSYWYFTKRHPHRKAFTNICGPELSSFDKKIVAHEIGHHVSLKHTHEDDSMRTENVHAVQCPGGKDSVMSYCTGKKHAFTTSERSKVFKMWEQKKSQGWADPVYHTVKYCQSGGGYHHGHMINSNSGAETAAECRSHCNERSQCKFWDFDGYVCRLRSSDGDSTPDGEGVVSDSISVTYGQRHCVFQCQSGGHYADAHLIQTSVKGSPWDCRQQCKNTWNCQFWDFAATSFYSGHCRLRKNDGSGPKQYSGDSFDSMYGYKDCQFGHQYRRALSLESEPTRESSTPAFAENGSISHGVLICGIIILIALF